MTVIVSQRHSSAATCAIAWRTSEGSMRQDVVTLPEDVRTAATRRGLARRRNAFSNGYIARKRGLARTTNPHQGPTGGWSRPLERCWYAGWDLAKANEETQA
jgi:hypothetical protein